MLELLEKLGIQWTLFIAQLVNFLLLFLILRKFLFAPLGKVLTQRKSDTQKLLSDQEDMIKKQENTKKESEAILHTAQKEAKELLVKAEEIAQEKTNSMIAKTTSQLEALHADHEKKLAQEIETAKKDLIKDSTDIAILLATKILKNEMKDSAQYKNVLASELEKLSS